MIDWKNIADKDVPGLSYRVTVDYDYGYEEPEGDGWTPKQVEAWKRDEWHYVYVVVTPVIDGDEIEMARVSLGGLEWGYFTATDEDDNITERFWIDLDAFCNGRRSADGTELYEAYPVPEMIEECRVELLQRLAPKMDALKTAYAALVAVVA